MNSLDVRTKFLSFFQQRGHTVVPSASLIPAGDPTLLFVNAGMVPFKDVFLGKDERSYSRATSVQRCLRVSGKHNDLEEIGPSPQHQTFFEMLGNFSFGDYFKAEALEFSWEFLTKDMGLPGEQLHPTVYVEDDESAKIWAKIKSVPERQIVRLGADENFWSMGDTGPCGPNSEIIFDRTGECRRDGSDCPITCDCDRWWELWNNVFMQYDRAADGTLTALPKKGVDTGMGLERLTAVLQEVGSTYETDLFTPILAEIADLTGVTYERATDAQRTALRILADHARATAFLIADGIRPSNEGRGYVLRRIMRRAIYYGRSRLISTDYLRPLVRRVGGLMSDVYPELHQAATALVTTAEEEEEKFIQTLGRGTAAVEALADSAQALRQTFRTAAEDPQAKFNWASRAISLADLHFRDSRLPETLKELFLEQYQSVLGAEPWNSTPEALRHAAAIEPTLNGEIAFFFKDTYGIPPDLTARVAEEHGLRVDLRGFEEALDEQRQRGREALGEARVQHEAMQAALAGLPPTTFLGYETLACDARVLGVLADGTRITEAGEARAIELVLDRTPFYAEGGGQAGDRGRISGTGFEIAVAGVRSANGVFVHSGTLTSGRIVEGDSARAEVDEDARRATMRNHTATHLLHKALRVVLGPEARQAGSLVAPDRLRFDFLHTRPLSDDELRETERIVREQVMLDRPVRTDVLPAQDAIASGADAMFDEKYGEEARVVAVGNGDVFSKELCGGTHCHATGEVGAFFIVDQRSVGAGVRRIEAVTGDNAYRWMDARRAIVEQLAREHNVPAEELPDRIHALEERAKEQPKVAVSNLPDPAQLIERAQRLGDNGALLIVDRVDAADADALRDFGDELRRRAGSAAVVLGTVIEDKPSIVVMLTPDQVQAGLDAAFIAKQLGREMGAGGGGRPDIATAGGREPSSLDAALAKAREILTAPAS
ncbi:MAG: alanine--tRNA ligase [Dehalococcoidia bacterium]